ncbi:hypothetical protein [Burkholderia lata]|uniref:hypothetical protein n=1 Tax=Burkholderia lata (strain ATCC 17760 / DSM 23089 / LMG 22485 / NCIMB 9086 / R18194 / 383) TaxID=482957 RepID=UPI00158168B9|nr:hypothetical protein [Burkholderia lata]
MTGHTMRVGDGRIALDIVDLNEFFPVMTRRIGRELSASLAGKPGLSSPHEHICGDISCFSDEVRR